jgi:AP-1 complex subunit gamma-1
MLRAAADLTAKLCSVAEKYAPSARWRVDTILKVMSIAGQYVTDEISSNLISLIANTPDLHAYAVQKMYLALTEDISQQSLVQVAVWTIGEFGDLLVTSSQISGEDTPLRVTEDDVLLLLTKILRTPATKSSTKRFILTALLKLSTRLPSHAQQRIRELIDEYLRHLNVELQQRSVEFDKILQLDSIRGSLLARMPVPDPKIPVAPEKSVSTNGAATSSPTATLLDPLAALGLGTSASSGTSAPYLDSSVDLLSLDFSSTPSQPVGGAPVAQPIDLMSQLFGSSNGTSTPPPAAPTGIAPVLSPSTTLTPSIATNGSNALSGFGQQFPTMTVLEAPEDGLTVTFDISKPQPQNPQFTLIIATFTNKSATSLTDFEMKTAVPTYLKLALMPASSTLIPPNNSVKVTQQVKIANSLHGEVRC